VNTGSGDRVTDVVVLGTGAAGLVAALAASDAGADVELLEKSDAVGGTTAISGGTCWVPAHHHGDELDQPDHRDDALAYLSSLSHGLIRPEIAEALVDNGPHVVDWIERTSALRFRVVQGFPDYHPEHPGGRPSGGRSLDPGLFPYDTLGDWAERVVRPAKNPYLTLPETSLGGGDGRIDRDELARRRAADLRGCGAALVGGLLRALLDRGVEPRCRHRARRLLTDEAGAVVGVVADTPDGAVRIDAPSGVVIATGGFEWNADMVASYLRGPMTSPASYPPNTGDGHIMAMEAGASMGMMREAWWVPTIEIPGDELFGRARAQIVLRERTLPRSIMVNRRGERFTNEAANYNALGGAFHQFDPTRFEYANLPCWIVFDHSYWSEYGFAGNWGETPPAWIVRGGDLDGLAGAIGLPHGSLERTVARWNDLVATGRDTDHGRGDSAYDGWNGDAGRRGTAAATLGPITDPPFYAVEVHSGCLGTKGGPLTDVDGCVLDHDRRVVDGLYAAGNAMSCPTGMVYGGAGGTLGPAITFGYLAGRHAAHRRTRSTVASGAGAP
jgi:3-oxosteroid 1-dehydrogenase